MTATHSANSTVSAAPVLYLALELSWKTWKLAFTTGRGQKPRLRTIPARNLEAFVAEVKAAKKRFGLPDDTPVISCYEAGCEAYWGMATNRDKLGHWPLLRLRHGGE